jgi:hypothetical protein
MAKSTKGHASAGTEKRVATENALPNTQQIAQRAYELYLARGGEHGRDADDWLQAERELRMGHR